MYCSYLWVVDMNTIIFILQIAFIYTFNLIVGAGALTMPKAFAQTGWILGLVAIGILAIMRFVSDFLICLYFTFVIGWSV